MIIKKIDNPIFRSELSSFFYPDQFVTEKQRNSKAYIKRIMDYFGSVAFTELNRKKNIIRNYKLRNGEFDFNDYIDAPELAQVDEILGEYSENEFTYLKHYPIINSPLNTLKGELIGRPRRERVKAVDDLSASEVLGYRTEVLYQSLIEKLQAKYTPDEENQLPEEFYKEISEKLTNYSTAAETWGNKALKAFKHFFNYSEKNEDGFMDFLTAGEEYHHFYPDNSKIGFNYKVENPVNVWYIAPTNARYTSDCSAVGTIELMSISSIIDEFKLDKAEIEQLTSKEITLDGDVMYTSQTPSLPHPSMLEWSMNYTLDGLMDPSGMNSFFYGNQQYHIVVRSYWKGKKKLFKRFYLDEEGYQRFEYVDENYKFNEDFGDTKLEEEWTNQWFKSARIGPYVYKEIEELEFNDTCPIVGIVNHTKNTKGRSLLDLMKGYQAAYNVCINQIWNLLSKEIGKVVLIDMKMIPRGESDNPIQDAVNNARDRGIIIVDTSIENTGGPLQFNQVTNADLTRSTEIMTRIQLAQALRAECWELIGISRQRTGSVLASETATGTNTALAQSYSQTEPWFKHHEDLMTQVLQTALNIMQYVELKKPESILNYLNSDLDNIFFKINRAELLRNLFVFTTSSKDDKEKLDMLKQLLQPAMQNGAELSDAADILGADSENRVKDVLKRIQERKEKQQKQLEEMEQQRMQMEQEQFQANQELLKQQHAEMIANDNLNKQADRETKIHVAEIQAYSFDDDKLDDTAGIADAAKLALEQSRDLFERTIKVKELQQEDRALDNQEKEIASREKIARMKPKPKAPKKK